MFPVAYAALGHKVIPKDQYTNALKTFKSKVSLLNDQLKGKHFLVGNNLTLADVMVACSLVVAYQTVFDYKFRKAMPHVSTWFEKCIGLPSFVRRLGYVKMVDVAFDAFDPNAPVKAPVAAKKETKKDDDDLDLFGDDSEDDGAAKKAAEEAKKNAVAKKKEKKPVIAMSLIMLEVKPIDDQTSLDKLAARIFKEIIMDGLYWKTEYKKEPVAFGIFKLICGFSCEDEKVSVDDVVEKIEELDDMV